MNISILGTGNVGRRLGQLLAAKGHRITFGSRLQNGESMVDLSFADTVTTYSEAVIVSDIVVIATPWAGDITLNMLRTVNKFEGKIVVDCTNPLAPDYMSNLIGHTTSAAEEIAKIVAPAQVVKAFNTIFAEVMEDGKQNFSDQMATGFYCGNDAEAKAIVCQLISDAGFDPVDAGSLKNARYLEPMAQLNIQIAYSMNGGTDVAFRYMRRPQTSLMPS
jgi:8-hydroxy-5-deazaflavin:NADPH oxidoreductase